METHQWEDNKQPDKPFNPLEAGKIKHCDLYNKCVDSCEDCLFNTLYHLNPKPGIDDSQWSYGPLADNEY